MEGRIFSYLLAFLTLVDDNQEVRKKTAGVEDLENGGLGKNTPLFIQQEAETREGTMFLKSPFAPPAASATPAKLRSQSRHTVTFWCLPLAVEDRRRNLHPLISCTQETRSHICPFWRELMHELGVKGEGRSGITCVSAEQKLLPSLLPVISPCEGPRCAADWTCRVWKSTAWLGNLANGLISAKLL